MNARGGAVAVGLALFAVVGCGGGASTPSSTQHTQSAAGGDAIRHVQDGIAAIYDAFTRAQGGRFCRLMTPHLRADLVAVAHLALPATRGMPCSRATMHFLEALGRGPFPAMDDAGNVAGDYDFRAIAIDGSTAVVRFPHARNWRLKLVGAHWLIDAFPILPTSMGKDLPEDLITGHATPA